MERAALQRDQTLMHQRFATIDQARALGAVLHCLLRDVVVVGFVRLRQIGRIGIRNRALVAHPCKCSRGVKATGKGDTDFLADREGEEDIAHIEPNFSGRTNPPPVWSPVNGRLQWNA